MTFGSLLAIGPLAAFLKRKARRACRRAFVRHPVGPYGVAAATVREGSFGGDSKQAPDRSRSSRAARCRAIRSDIESCCSTYSFQASAPSESRRAFLACQSGDFIALFAITRLLLIRLLS